MQNFHIVFLRLIEIKILDFAFQSPPRINFYKFSTIFYLLESLSSGRTNSNTLTNFSFCSHPSAMQRDSILMTFCQFWGLPSKLSIFQYNNGFKVGKIFWQFIRKFFSTKFVFYEVNCKYLQAVYKNPLLCTKTG